MVRTLTLSDREIIQARYASYKWIYLTGGRILELGARTSSFTNVDCLDIEVPADHSDSFIQADFHQLPLCATIYDTVIMVAAFHHSSCPRTLLREIHRVLKPHGRLYLCEETPIRWWERCVWVKRWLKRDGMSWPFATQVLVDKQLGDYGWSRREYRHMLADTGFHLLAEGQKYFFAERR